MPDAAEEYRGQHTAPGRDSAPAHDLIGSGVYPKDVYQRPDWYEQGDGLAVMRRVLALKDRPDAKVAIYRAIPTEVYKREMAAAEKSGEPFLNRVIRPGDWVTIDKIYAKEHGESALNGDFKVVHKNVPASHIFTNGDSIMEWGYHPDTAKVGQRNFMPDTLEFRQRLQGTKVSDKYGAPLRVYHGSPQSGLSELKANDGAIFFTDSADVAKGYTAKRGIWMSKPTGEVRSAFLDVRNPLEIDALGKRNDNIPVPWQEWKSKVYGNLPANAVSVEVAAKRAKEMGHDALIVRNVIDTADTDGKKKSTVFAVFDPSQVMLHGEEPKPQVNFMPEAMPNGTVYRSNVGFSVVNKTGGKFRVYSPVGTLIAVANSLEEAQRMIERKAK